MNVSLRTMCIMHHNCTSYICAYSYYNIVLGWDFVSRSKRNRPFLLGPRSRRQDCVLGKRLVGYRRWYRKRWISPRSLSQLCRQVRLPTVPSYLNSARHSDTQAYTEHLCFWQVVCYYPLTFSFYRIVPQHHPTRLCMPLTFNLAMQVMAAGSRVVGGTMQAGDGQEQSYLSNVLLLQSIFSCYRQTYFPSSYLFTNYCRRIYLGCKETF